MKNTYPLILSSIIVFAGLAFFRNIEDILDEQQDIICHFFQTMAFN